MFFSSAQTYLSDILHAISQALLIPVILLLILFIGYALFCIGSVVSEYFTERKRFQVAMPKFLAELMAAKQDEIPGVIEQSGLLNRQKTALLTVYDYRMLPGDALVALIKRLVSEEESRYDKISSRNNMAARVSPMIGLMGTLIPLGPGIEALGRADTAALSSSLLIAFDTTVAGLIVAAVCLVIGKIRNNWYENYLSALDAAMATMLEKVEGMRAAGEIVTEEPSDYAFLFEQRIGRKDGEGAGKRAEAPADLARAGATQRGDAPARHEAGLAAQETAADQGQGAPDAAQAAAASIAAPAFAAGIAVLGDAADVDTGRGELSVDQRVGDFPTMEAAQPAAAEAPEAREAGIHFEPPRRPWESGE